MNKFYLASLLSVCYFSAIAQPANDNPCGAINIAVLAW